MHFRWMNVPKMQTDLECSMKEVPMCLWWTERKCALQCAALLLEMTYKLFQILWPWKIFSFKMFFRKKKKFSIRDALTFQSKIQMTVMRMTDNVWLTFFALPVSIDSHVITKPSFCSIDIVLPYRCSKQEFPFILNKNWMFYRMFFSMFHRIDHRWFVDQRNKWVTSESDGTFFHSSSKKNILICDDQ